MDLECFVNNYSQDSNLGRAICLYIIASKNLAPAFQKQNFCRCGVAGSREQANIDRSVTASGAESRASSLYSRAAMYLANSIAGMNIIAVLKLPPSVINAPTGPTITRVLQQRRQGDNRPDYALQGKTMAVALESIYHMNLDDMPGVSRARTARQEWFKSEDAKFSKVNLHYKLSDKGNSSIFPNMVTCCRTLWLARASSSKAVRSSIRPPTDFESRHDSSLMTRVKCD